MAYLGEFEQLILFSVLALGGGRERDAYDRMQAMAKGLIPKLTEATEG